MIHILLVLVLVVILGFCLTPRVVRSTPPSPGAVELYMIEYASGIEIAGAQITFPADYGTVEYDDGTSQQKELYDMRVRILQGTGAKQTALTSVVVSSPNQLPGVFTPVPGSEGISKTQWFKPSQKGQKATLTLSTPQNYTNGENIYLEIGFRNSQSDGYTTTTKSYGSLTPTLTSTTLPVLSVPTIMNGIVTYK